MRIAGAILIVFAASTVGYAQQLEQPPLIPPRREVPPGNLFPTPSIDSPFFPRIPPRPEVSADQFLPRTPLDVPGTFPQRRQATQQAVPAPRSGPVCLRAVPVDPAIDPAFVIALPDNDRNLPMRRIEMPPCVTLAPQQTP